MADIEKLAEEICGLTLLEAAELGKILEDKLGVSAAAMGPMMMPGAGMMPGGVAAAGAGEEAAPEEEEQTEFDVQLKEIGPNKIPVIKEVRAVTGLGLKEAKEAVEAAPNVIKEGVTKEEAEKIKEQLEAVNAVVEIL